MAHVAVSKKSADERLKKIRLIEINLKQHLCLLKDMFERRVFDLRFARKDIASMRQLIDQIAVEIERIEASF